MAEHNVDNTLNEMRQYASEGHLQKLAHFGIPSDHALGIRQPDLKRIAKKIKMNHALALELFETGIHEARILAAMILDPKKTTLKQIHQWSKVFYSWDLVDSFALYHFRKTPFAWKLPFIYAPKKEEYQRRLAFTMIAVLAVHEKKAHDERFEEFFPLIKKYSTDKRNFVKRAVNWALRQIGKKNPVLRKKAIRIAQEILKTEDSTAQWIARDALRELL